MIKTLSKPLTRFRWLQSLTLATLSALLTTLPIRAAEKLYIPYGPLVFSLSVSSLEKYAKDGTVEPDLASYLKFLKPEARTALREMLKTPYAIAPLAVSQIIYSPLVVSGMRQIGDLVQIPFDINGFYALRAALVQSAAEPEGLTVIGILRNFPTQGIWLNTPLFLQTQQRLEQMMNANRAAVAEIDKLSKAAAATEGSANIAQLPKLSTEPGSFGVSTQTLVLRDTKRNRVYPADLYLPQISTSSPGSIPVLVLSHGLGESRAGVAPLARYLASYGFAVGVPDHIDSDTAQQERLRAGRAREQVKMSTFYDRPLDVSFLLDELEQRNQTEWQQRLNLQKVGVIGHSLGGYTALALAGATVDFKLLQQKCTNDFLLRTVNLASVLQCGALDLLKTAPQMAQQLAEQGFGDSRVKFIAAINPVSYMFGPTGISRIKIPVMLGAGGKDPVTPLIMEQAPTFTWLTNSDKYLLVSTASSHLPQLAELINRAILTELSPSQIDKELQTLREDGRALIMAFSQVYVANRQEYAPYLQSSYVESISQEPFNVSLVRSLTSDQLAEIIKASTGITPTGLMQPTH